jgi:hypothetical protein
LITLPRAGTKTALGSAESNDWNAQRQMWKLEDGWRKTLCVHTPLQRIVRQQALPSLPTSWQNGAGCMEVYCLLRPRSSLSFFNITIIPLVLRLVQPSVHVHLPRPLPAFQTAPSPKVCENVVQCTKVAHACLGAPTSTDPQ